MGGGVGVVQNRESPDFRSPEVGRYAHGCVLLCHLENSPDSFKIVSTFLLFSQHRSRLKPLFWPRLVSLSLNILSRFCAFIVLHTSSGLV